VDLLRASIVELAELPGTFLERDLTQALVLPQLTSLLRDLFTRTSDPTELEDARRRIRDALRIVAAASGVFAKHDRADVADRLAAVSMAVTQAISPPPEQPL
jgi:hypothetical protein